MSLSEVTIGGLDDCISDTMRPIGLSRQYHAPLATTHRLWPRRLAVRGRLESKIGLTGFRQTDSNGAAANSGDALGRSRTFNLRIKSPLLCQLSYECDKRMCRKAGKATSPNAGL